MIEMKNHKNRSENHQNRSGKSPESFRKPRESLTVLTVGSDFGDFIIFGDPVSPNHHYHRNAR